MRPFAIAIALAAVTTALPVDAQQVRHMNAGGGMQTPRPMPGPAPMMPRPGGWTGPRNPAHPMPNMPNRPRWGGNVGGRWYAGVYAPGGWNAYRRPVRGWTLPTYWYAPTFYITDYSAYGLGAPPSGYNWTRYYDDAVLVDGRGQVYDSVSGLNWDDQGYDVDAGPAMAPPPPPPVAYAPPPPPVAGPAYAPPPPRRDNGVGGALIGGAVGGVAGNLIAGKGNRLAGTLIGAGVGAVAGAAIDQAEDRGRRPRRIKPPKAGRYPAPPPYGYDAPYYNGYPAGGYAPPPVVYAPPAEVVQGYSSSAFTHSYDASAYYGAGAYTNVYYAPGTTTTVTVIPGTTTTTETEYVYETAVAAPKRTYAHKRVYKPRPKARVCSCVCRPKVVCR